MSGKQTICRACAQHNEPQAANGKFTLKNGPWTLVWSEPHPTRVSAMARRRRSSG